MTQEKLKQFLDACFDAKRLIEKLPDLPDGMKPRQVHVLDAVNEIQKKQGFCRVSDISSYMNTTLPSITKLETLWEEDAADWIYVDGEVRFRSSFLKNVLKTRKEY